MYIIEILQMMMQATDLAHTFSIMLFFQKWSWPCKKTKWRPFFKMADSWVTKFMYFLVCMHEFVFLMISSLLVGICINTLILFIKWYGASIEKAQNMSPKIFYDWRHSLLGDSAWGSVSADIGLLMLWYWISSCSVPNAF